MTPGVHDDVPNDVYHASPGISKSGLVTFARSPRRFRYGERTETRPMQLGSLTHCALFEPQELSGRYYPTNVRKDERSAAWKQVVTRAFGREIVHQTDYDKARRMADSAMREPIARELITEDAVVERSYAWHDPATGVLCRARTDLIEPTLRVILDAKKTGDARPWAFARAVAQYRYHWQPAFYGDGMLLADGWQPQAFIFLAIEDEAPFECAPHEVREEDVAQARVDIAKHLARYAECLARDEWPGLSQEINLLDLPRYAHDFT